MQYKPRHSSSDTGTLSLFPATTYITAANAHSAFHQEIRQDSLTQLGALLLISKYQQDGQKHIFTFRVFSVTHCFLGMVARCLVPDLFNTDLQS